MRYLISENPMIIDNLNLNLIRVFESVYRTGSMTKAASELHMTQSGVSQNIKNLEDLLEVKLFDRVKQRPLPTEKAKVLFENCHPYLEDLEETLALIKGEQRSLKGRVTIGVPIEYGNNVVIPLLAKWGAKHPGIQYKLLFGHASEMNNLLLQGAIDFAFVDSYGLDKQIIREDVGGETLILCASKDYLKGQGKVQNKKHFEGLDYISYIEDAPVLRQWFSHHYQMNNFSGNIRASLMDVQGMARMIGGGLGLGVLPDHVVKKMKEEGVALQTFKGSGKPLLNRISMASLKERTQSPLVSSTMDFLKSKLGSQKG